MSDWDDVTDTISDGIISVASGAAAGIITKHIVKAAAPGAHELVSSGSGIVTGLLTTFIVGKVLSPPGKKATGLAPSANANTDALNKKADERVAEMRRGKSTDMIRNIFAGVATGIATMYMVNQVAPKKTYQYGRQRKQ
jgi:hypothetical protein